MSRVMDVPSKLGEYMLKGWVLTDNSCPSCHLPQLRTPNTTQPTQLLCVACDLARIEQGTSSVSQQLPPPQRRISTASTMSSLPSRASTPPTDVTPPPSPPFVIPPPTPEQLRRRAQSDMASREIGAKMLRGYAMLAEECPNSTCYGIPLVRPPKPGSKDPRKECVVCGNIYIDDGGATTALVSPSGAQISNAGRAAFAPKVDKGKDRTDSSFQAPPEDRKPQTPISPVARPGDQPGASNVRLRQPAHTLVTSVPPSGGEQPGLAEQLRHALDVLGEALVQAIREVDIEKIGHISDAIGKTAGALQVVQRLK